MLALQYKKVIPVLLLLASVTGVCQKKVNTDFQRKEVKVFGATMSYLEAQSKSDTVFVFIHGNPTQAYMWRNVIPYVAELGSCVAPDLIGMGKSDKLSSEVTDRYTFISHEKYLDEFLRITIRPYNKVVLVGHDWGGVLAHAWARKNSARVAGVVIMETFLEPHYSGVTPKPVIDWFKLFHTDSMATEVLVNNHFVERVLLKNLLTLSDSERNIYRMPFMNEEDRLPTLIWPQQVPIDGTPSVTDEVFKQNLIFMANASFTKLFINAQPGALLAPEARRNKIRSWANVTEIKVTGNHYVVEQSPDDVGKAIVQWINDTRKQSGR